MIILISILALELGVNEYVTEISASISVGDSSLRNGQLCGGRGIICWAVEASKGQ